MTNLTPLDRESLLDEIRRLLPAPLREEAQLDGSTVLVGGDPGEVIVRMTGSKVSIGEFTVRWEGPHTPVARPKRLAMLDWKNLPASRTVILLHMLIEAARDVRRARYRRCERCGDTKPPEWMHGENICQSCAEQQLGVVY